MSNKAKLRRRDAGISVIEYIIALIFIMIAFVGWLQLTSTAVKNGQFVKRLADVGAQADQKATELSGTAISLFNAQPSTVNRLGSVAPESAQAGYFDTLNEQGEVINGTTSNNVPVFQRQWLLLRDQPHDNDITICVSVSYIGSAGKVLRLVKLIKTEAPVQ